jgi:hypothetical protein
VQADLALGVWPFHQPVGVGVAACEQDLKNSSVVDQTAKSPDQAAEFAIMGCTWKSRKAETKMLRA